MIRQTIFALGLAGGIAGCAELPGTSELVSACQFYVTVAAVAHVAAALHPAIASAVAAITDNVDPVCRLVLAGQPAPAGINAAWVREKTMALETLEAGARPR